MAETLGQDDPLKTARARLRAASHCDETGAIAALLARPPYNAETRTRIVAMAQAIIGRSRDLSDEQGTLDAFLQEFGLSNQEGVALMCLAEALLRVPDAGTRDTLIGEKLRTGDWASHKGKSTSPFVNASVLALMLTGRIVRLDRAVRRDPSTFIEGLVRRAGEPVIREAIGRAMMIMGRQFVFGRNITDALKRMDRLPVPQRLMSFDMLGEGARTASAAQHYLELYHDAISAVGEAVTAQDGGPELRSSVSIKLSALHPRYETVKQDRVCDELVPRLLGLARLAKSHDIQLTIDAEEADRLDLSLTLFEALARSPDLAGWNGLGLAVQAYQKRAGDVIDWLLALAADTGRRIPVRLVKGAYWDSEIKHAQMMGLPDYPVWTRKPLTDLSYLACARKLIDGGAAFFPQFATHNAHSIAAISAMAAAAPFEFQRLHGMGDLLYRAAADALGRPLPVRVYAPVGAHRDLLPYLVRRLLENGANSSFVNRFMDRKVPISEIARDPLETIGGPKAARNDQIPLPRDIYGPRRVNSKGWNMQDRADLDRLIAAVAPFRDDHVMGPSLVAGKVAGGAPVTVTSPVDRRRVVGETRHARAEDRDRALAAAASAFSGWNASGGPARAVILRAMADRLEDNLPELVCLMAREAGKTLADGIAEVREAVDFCRYYAAEAEAKFGAPTRLPGPTGESNDLYLEGRGVFLAISPWNFPLAIFTGQVAAALAAGNCVIAKPAEQTPLIAARAVALFHEAGLPVDTLHLLQGPGPEVAGPLISDPRISGVVFTGSTDTARIINRALAARDGAIHPLIAETGGQNAMIVDSTALSEQVVDDALMSAFGSAGQRCSALRILCLQEEVADDMIAMLSEALAERRAGDPLDPATDIGPIIDEAAREGLLAHIARMDRIARPIAVGHVPEGLEAGVFLAPRIYEIDSISVLEREVFGPVLHVLRYRVEALPELMAALAATGFGLTFGIHSRLEARGQTLFTQSRAGNVYVNRNMIGAVVGVQPFGGTGLSGTGPKAGGPHYLLRFASERVRTVNLTAIGGNTDLFRLGG